MDTNLDRLNNFFMPVVSGEKNVFIVKLFRMVYIHTIQVGTSEFNKIHESYEINSPTPLSWDIGASL